MTDWTKDTHNEKNNFLVFVVTLLVKHAAATTITYTYDSQHRLVSVDYSEAQPDTHVVYQYDAANNVNLIVAITDSQWLRSFMLWLSAVWTGNDQISRS